MVEFAPHPPRLVYWILVILFVLATIPIVLMPDVAVRTPGALRSMRPQIGIPQMTRPTFVALAPTLVAIWALAGLYLAMGPSLARLLLETDSTCR